MKKALISGISGQCGSYLAEHLLTLNYEIHGIQRRISQPNLSNLSAVVDKIHLHTGDMQDATSLFRILREVQPDEIYNLAAQSDVRASYDNVVATFDINANGLLRILESMRTLELNCKLYQQSSSEMFGKVQEVPQTENTKFYPRSPYGVSKVAAHNLARVWREAYGLPIYCGILYNNESPRRGPAFLSRKVCIAVAEIAAGKRDRLVLGNLEARRDWGYSPEYMKWVHAIVQHPEPDDFLLASGENHSIREWVEEAFELVGISNWEDYVEFDSALLRPAEVDTLLGNANKAKEMLGFSPQVKFNSLVKLMLDAEMEKLKCR